MEEHELHTGLGSAPDVTPDGRHADGVTAWLARLSATEAARERSRIGWLRRQAAEEGTFVGVLADLAERGRPVTVHLANGRSHRAQIRVLGTDFAVLRTVADAEVILRYDAIDNVRTIGGEPSTTGDRCITTTATLAEALHARAEERPWVLVVGNDPGAGVHGELRAVGVDVVTLRLDGGATAYVALSAVAEVVDAGASPTASG